MLQASRSSGKIHSFGKREQSIKRNPNVPVVVRGWLYKQDSSGMRLWKRKWFVLADFCLFYYKGQELMAGHSPRGFTGTEQNSFFHQKGPPGPEAASRPRPLHYHHLVRL
ncbi:Pleckstrin y domain-containing A member 7 [Ilyodon furcidens]|uniref:Pleckstrin y domain-containing A member 7 n=1 Tax=Ilyodon furcidens TaxID=33524 RepID=A0ABV0UHF2_9TELE